MLKFRTDKIGHGYLPVYLDICAQLQTKVHTTFKLPVRLLEIGVANGEGLEMFSHLLPYAELWGVDSNEQARWPEGTSKLVARQEDPSLPNMVPGMFDLIVDDASHDNMLTYLTWKHMWHKVVSGGFYVVEDWNHAGGLIRQFAKDLVDCFDESKPLDERVDSITYRHGLIILRKKVAHA